MLEIFLRHRSHHHDDRTSMKLFLCRSPNLSLNHLDEAEEKKRKYIYREQQQKQRI